jgi:hypothetical protein
MLFFLLISFFLFKNLQALLDAKVKIASGESLQLPGRNPPADAVLNISGEVYPTAYAEPLNYDYSDAKDGYDYKN